MTFTGVLRGRGLASSPGCAPVPYQIAEPTRTIDNLLIMEANLNHWATLADEWTMRGVAPDVVTHAHFAVDTLFTVQQNVLVGVCCALLALTVDNAILAATVFMKVPQRGPEAGSITLLTTAPPNLAGSPHPRPLRGLGTALVAVASQQLLSEGVTVIYLHPLDASAHAFWSRRGFVACGEGGLLCIRGRAQIETLIGRCQKDPEDGSILCGIPSAVRKRMVKR